MEEWNIQVEELEDAAGEGSSCQVDHTSASLTDVKIEQDNGDDDSNFNTMDFLELAEATDQTSQEPIEFDSTDAMENPKTGIMVCLHCLENMERSLLYDHMVNAHNYRRIFFKCQSCNSIFKEKCLMLEHKKSCEVPVKKKAPRKSMAQLLREVEAIVAEDYFEYGSCPVCMIELPKTVLKEHLISQHDKQQSILCDKCFRTFKSKFTLREHIKLVHLAVKDSEECEFCGQKFGSAKYLSNHKRNVHPPGDKEYRCHVCAKIFKSRLCLHQHCKYVHPPESASAACPHCPKVFKTAMNLQQHLRISHGKRGSRK